ncbi:MAG: hypothetical protein IT567_01980 [Alphaproteobacteria bacterium]|nr:hypothetical protein [Alphaproteobacteria bacterium]
MRIIKTLTATAIGLVMWSAAAQAEEYPFAPKRSFDSAIVHYETTGGMMQGGKSTLYVKGEYQALEKEGSGPIPAQHTITTPDYIYVINKADNTAMRSENPSRMIRAEWEKATAEEKATIRSNVEKFGVAFGDRLGAKMEKRGGEVLGRACDKTTVMQMSNCMWSDAPDIMLQSDMSAMGGGVETAVKIEENAALPAGVFDVPAGMKVTDSPDNTQARNMALKFFAALKDPNYSPEKTQASMGLGDASPAAGEMRMPSAEEMQQMQEGMKEMQKAMQDPEMQEMMKQMKQYQPQQ